MIEFINTHYVMGFFLLFCLLCSLSIIGIMLVAGINSVIVNVFIIINNIVKGHYSTKEAQEDIKVKNDD